MLQSPAGLEGALLDRVIIHSPPTLSLQFWHLHAVRLHSAARCLPAPLQVHQGPQPLVTERLSTAQGPRKLSQEHHGPDLLSSQRPQSQAPAGLSLPAWQTAQ